MASRLPLKSYRSIPGFMRDTIRIRRQLGQAAGLVGYTLNAGLWLKDVLDVLGLGGPGQPGQVRSQRPPPRHHRAAAPADEPDAVRVFPDLRVRPAADVGADHRAGQLTGESPPNLASPGRAGAWALGALRAICGDGLEMGAAPFAPASLPAWASPALLPGGPGRRVSRRPVGGELRGCLRDRWVTGGSVRPGLGSR